MCSTAILQISLCSQLVTHWQSDAQCCVRGLTTVRPVPLQSWSDSRNSPDFLGSMLSCSCSGSSPAPGRHSGRILEWHTDTRTDMRTVWQPSCVGEAPWWLGTTEDWSAVWPGAGVHPPELSDILPTDACRKQTRGPLAVFRSKGRLL